MFKSKGLMKIVSSIMIASLMLVSFAACQSGSGTSQAPASSEAPASSAIASEETITLAFWHVYTADPQKTLVTDMVSEWNEQHPNIQIVESSTAKDPYKTKIKTAIAADEAPDIIFSWPEGFAKPFVDAGKILQLDSYLTDEVKNKLFAGALVQYNGETYGVSKSQQCGVLFVNTKMFADNNVKIPGTYDELLDAVKAFRALGITPFAVGEKDEWPGMWYYNVLALREGGSQASKAALGKTASFDDPIFINAAAKLQELVKAGAFDPGVMGISFADANAQFKAGASPMYYGLGGLAGTFTAEDSTITDVLDVIPFPTITGGSSDPGEYVGGGSDCLMVNAGTKYKEEAVEAALYLTEMMSLRFYLSGNGLPMWKYDNLDQSTVNPLVKKIMDTIVTGSKDNVSAWDIYLEGADAQTHKDLVARIFGDEISPEDFASKMQSQLNG